MIVHDICNVLFTINSTCFDSILIPLSKGAVHWPWQVNQQQGWPVCVVAGWRQEDQHRILKLTHSPPPLVVSLYMVPWLLLVNSLHLVFIYILMYCILHIYAFTCIYATANRLFASSCSFQVWFATKFSPSSILPCQCVKMFSRFVGCSYWNLASLSGSFPKCEHI